ncbi:MAG: ABC transporter ATP-binding protein/permease [Syntrophales bacterium]|jgi:ATP-binding cassette subfamily B protein|nr:ABC transporter ATP-binding protein/permease [Syntrophales bacterium]
MRIPYQGRATGRAHGALSRYGKAFRGKVEKAQDPRHSLRRLSSYLSPYRLQLIVVCAIIIIYTILGLVGPYLMGMAIDKFIAVKKLSGLREIALLMLLAYVLENLLHGLSAWMMADISQRALKKLRGEMFSHLQRLPLSFFDNNPAGELMSRLTNDIDAVNQTVSQNFTSLFASVLSLAGIIIAMFALNFWLALVSLLIIPIILVFANFIARYTRRGFRDLQKHLGELNGVMEEAISGQKVVKTFGRGETTLATFRRSNEAVFHAAVSANVYAMLLIPLTGVLGNFFIIALAGFGGWLALGGLVSVGVIATFINYAQNFISPLRQLAGMYNSIQAALAGAERVFEILDTPPEADEAAGAAPLGSLTGDVAFEDVSFGYNKGNNIIKEMTFTARNGETLALAGPTGAGKTTIINLLTRFYEVDKGRITIEGRDIRTIGKADLRRQLGIVSQDTFLFSGTVLENIRYGRLAATDQECMEAAKLAEADPFIRQLPNGYETGLSERAGNLSQGQRQLLSIARAILAAPAILILDEATSSVDTRTEIRIQTALLRLMQGRTSFVIAHRLSTIRDASQLLVIDKGEIVEQGTHQELLGKKGLYHRLYLSQFYNK